MSVKKISKEAIIMKGKFITFEGLDGTGKTTAMNIVVKRLENRLAQYKIVATREPGGAQIAEKIRNLILDNSANTMDGKTEALLYAAARREHFVNVIKPALETGNIVLCDRYVDSSLAYQGQGRHLGMDKVADINKFATDGLKPDVTFYFDLAPEEGLNRIKKHRSNEINRLDEEDLTFYNEVQKGYEKLISDDPQRFVRIDATQSANNIADEIISKLIFMLF